MLPWLGTHLGTDSLLFLPGRGEEAGEGKVLSEGEKLWWLFPCGIVLKRRGLVLAPPEAAGRAGPKPSKDLGQSREKKTLILLRTQWSLRGPIWLCSEPGKGGISPLRTTRATGARSLRKQLFFSCFLAVSVLATQPIPACPSASPLVSTNALEIPGTWSSGRGSCEFLVCISPEEERVGWLKANS